MMCPTFVRKELNSTEFGVEYRDMAKILKFDIYVTIVLNLVIWEITELEF